MSHHAAAGVALVVALFGGLFVAAVRVIGWRGTVFAYAFTGAVVGVALASGFLIEGRL